MCFLFTLVTGNCDVLECAPVLLITLQRQLLGSGKYVTDRGRHVILQNERKTPFSLLLVKRKSGGGEIIYSMSSKERDERNGCGGGVAQVQSQRGD